VQEEGRNGTSMRLTSELVAMAANPVKDSSFLGETASALCDDTPVYWIFQSQGNNNYYYFV
jgi:hypothetical protein